jgi:hypothetical protein
MRRYGRTNPQENNLQYGDWDYDEQRAARMRQIVESLN